MEGKIQWHGLLVNCGHLIKKFMRITNFLFFSRLSGTGHWKTNIWRDGVFCQGITFLYVNICNKTLWLVVPFHEALCFFMSKAMFWILPVFSGRENTWNGNWVFSHGQHRQSLRINQLRIKMWIVFLGSLQSVPQSLSNFYILLLLFPLCSPRSIVKCWENNCCVAIKCLFQVYSTDGRQVSYVNTLTSRNKGGKFLKKLWCCLGGEYYKIIWFYQLG